jgi:hypothetical protein
VRDYAPHVLELQLASGNSEAWAPATKCGQSDDSQADFADTYGRTHQALRPTRRPQRHATALSLFFACFYDDSLD